MNILIFNLKNLFRKGVFCFFMLHYVRNYYKDNIVISLGQSVG